MASPNGQLQAYSATSGSPTNSHRPNPPAHTRTYQACIPCRRRKVRCDLGPVDSPHDPPCVRCRRESKECFFSNTRRKRRNSDDEEVYDDNGDDYEARNGRKRVRGDPTASPFGDGPRRPHGLDINAANNMNPYGHGTHLPPLTPGGSIGRSQPLRRPNDPQPEHREEDAKVNNETAAILQTKEVYSGHDALNLLFEAAGRNGDIAHHRTTSTTSTNRPTLTPGSTSTAPASYANHRFNGNAVNSPVQDRNVNGGAGSATVNGLIKDDSQEDPGFQQAVKAWQRFRFVRAGWFTAREGIMYIRYFFKYLSPLTPVVVPNFEDYSTHKKMLEDEPMLVVTLLTIASRYMTLSGPGSSSRPYAIHQKLWSYLQGMIDRLLWGQEQFGGGFCGAGAQQNSDVNPVTRKGLRTLGTVESLLLLMEWHPRSMHFPPGENDDELMIPENVDTDASNCPAANGMLVEGHGGQRLDSWLEPCWRSDRVCWMLIGNAITLATEIGVFDENFDLNADGTSQDVSREQTTAYLRRRNHLKQLLAVYLLQTAGRQGLISMLPQIQRDVKKGDDILNATRIGGLLSSPQFQSSQLASGHMQQGQDTVLALWISVAKIMELGNQKLFPNRNATRHLIKSGKYLEQLQFFGPITKQWREEFEKSRPHLTPLMQHILEIEFEYSRVYLNALALQAVVERCANNTPLQATAHPHANGNSSIKTDGGVIPPSTLMKWSGADRPYIHQVIDAARNVLRVVIDGLYPNEYLKHAPVRTFFRIISVAIILLKTFALGATEDDVAISLSLMHGAVEKLRTSIVDDVHVGTRFADLLETLTNRIRSRFVRMSGTGAPSRATSRSPAPSVYQTNGSSQMLPPSNHHTHQASQWSNGGDFMSSPLMSRGQQTPNSNGALWGISTESYDPGSSNVSIMPPPTYSNGNFGHNAAMNNHNFNANGAGGLPNMTDQDWLALPLDPLIASYGMDVNGSAYGPVVGDYDILDLLLDPPMGP